MRLPILVLFLIAATWLGQMQAASAQSPTNYPWCARAYKMDTSATSCYFTSREQCMGDAVRDWRVLLRKPVFSLGACQDDGAAA